MTLPSKIPVLANSSIASYSFDEVRDGLGYVTFYVSQDDAGPWLSTEQNRSKTNEHNYNDITYVVGGGAWELSGSHTIHFSGSSFILPRTVTGEATVEGWWQATRASGAGAGSVLLELAITKNAVDIGATSGSSLSGINATGTYISGGIFRNITLTETHFARGDVIGLRMTQWGTGTTTPFTADSFIGTDPVDRDATIIKPSTNANATTILKVTVPVRIDIQ